MKYIQYATKHLPGLMLVDAGHVFLNVHVQEEVLGISDENE